MFNFLLVVDKIEFMIIKDMNFLTMFIITCWLFV